MLKRTALLGFALGLATALAPACAPTKPPASCSSANCNGCCQDKNTCLTGDSKDTCGKGGASCQACGSAQVCTTDGLCKFGSNQNNTDGGAGSGGSGGTGGTGGSAGAGGSAGTGGSAGAGGCGPANCNGCCSASGKCYDPATDLACGKGGGTCQSCALGFSCKAGVCTGACTTCLDSNGACVSDGLINPTACGANGVQCVACGTNDVCTNGSCVPKSTGCNAANCSNGCCSGNTCVTQQSDSQCGLGGTACQACLIGTSCEPSSGTCTQSGFDGGIFPPFDGGIFPPLDGGLFTCDASNCSGCCLFGVCMPGTDGFACGKGAQTCLQCVFTSCDVSGTVGVCK